MTAPRLRIIDSLLFMEPLVKFPSLERFVSRAATIKTFAEEHEPGHMRYRLRCRCGAETTWCGLNSVPDFDLDAWLEEHAGHNKR